MLKIDWFLLNMKYNQYLTVSIVQFKILEFSGQKTEDVKVFIKLVKLSFKSIKGMFDEDTKKEEGKVMLLILYTTGAAYS